MLQPSIRVPARLFQACCCSLETSFSRLRISPQSQSRISLSKTTVRNATHKSEGRANRAKQGPGKRLGAKKTGDQYVIPGNILYRQRGTLWHAGENVGMGRDHTLFATSPGFVKYYRDPQRHKSRRYIGVVLERHHTLPLLKGVARKRRLGMYAQRIGGEPETVMDEVDVPADVQISGEGGTTKVIQSFGDETRPAEITPARPGYQNRRANWVIGKTMESSAEKTRPFKPGERFLAWRKRMANRARATEKRGLKAQKKGKK